MIDLLITIFAISSIFSLLLLFLNLLLSNGEYFDMFLGIFIVSLILFFGIGAVSIMQQKDSKEHFKSLTYKETIDKYKISNKDFVFIEDETKDQLKERLYLYIKSRNETIKKNKDKIKSPILKSIIDVKETKETKEQNKYQLKEKDYEVTW